MASSMVLSKGSSASKLLLRSLSGSQPSLILRSAIPSVRSFNTSVQMHSPEDTDDDCTAVDGYRRPDRSAVRLFPDVFDPLYPSRSLGQVLNLMDQFMENPFSSAIRGAGSRGWNAREDEEGLHLKLDMPGLGKEDVKVSVEQNMLVIKGEGEKESPDAEEVTRRRYSSRIELPSDAYKLDEIKAEMKNGVLKVVVPRMKEEERKDVFHVQID
ncbi:hypothetical protein QJS04_geneDACA009329 [Acorus gramineus]|uniref:SHSP domain-containing protein n=1 Tax=Acorus gramineus TaxID=55184 RepID=A0AAV9AJE9_ACOGR|nr:hypothetical protein QJS04_geneDACA009329 [Acorus gramineus]